MRKLEFHCFHILAVVVVGLAGVVLTSCRSTPVPPVSMNPGNDQILALGSKSVGGDCARLEELLESNGVPSFVDAFEFQPDELLVTTRNFPRAKAAADRLMKSERLSMKLRCNLTSWNFETWSNGTETQSAERIWPDPLSTTFIEIAQEQLNSLTNDEAINEHNKRMLLLQTNSDILLSLEYGDELRRLHSKMKDGILPERFAVSKLPSILAMARPHKRLNLVVVLLPPMYSGNEAAECRRIERVFHDYGVKSLVFQGCVYRCWLAMFSNYQ